MNARHLEQGTDTARAMGWADTAFETALLDAAELASAQGVTSGEQVANVPGHASGRAVGRTADQMADQTADQAVPADQAADQTADQAVPADQFNFKRYELKYLISPEQRAELDRLIAENLVPDEHGRSLVSSIYYDTPSDLLMRRSIEGGMYKEKLRVRLYGPLGPSSQVFVEIKKKCEGVVYKRRVAAAPAQADKAIAQGQRLGEGQIAREIEGFVARYPGIEAAMLVSCERCAYHTPSETGEVLGGGSDAATELRLTLDENIRWLDREDGRVWFDRAGEGRELIPEGYVLMEAKCGGALPLWFVDFLSRGEIRSRSFSKCGTAYRTRLAERTARRAEAQREHVAQPVTRRTSQPVARPTALPAPSPILPRHVAKPRILAPALGRSLSATH